MKTFIISVFLVTIQLYSQSPAWHTLPNTPYTPWRHDDVSFISETNIWVTNNINFGGGNSAKVYKSTNGGQNWTIQFTKSNQYFRCIGFLDSLNGILGTLGNMIGLNGPALYKTTNGGMNWDSVSISPSPPYGLCGISILQPSSIFACGRVGGPAYFIKSTNGGLNWISQNMSAYAYELIDCKFFSDDSGFVIGAVDTVPNSKGVVLFTSNGGNSWIERYRGNRPYDGLWKISFINRNTGYVSFNLNEDTLFFLKTTNGGLSWQRGFQALGVQTISQGIGFINENTGWIGGDFTNMYKTTNGGISWQLDNWGRFVNRIRFINDTLGYAVGREIYKYTTEPIGIKPISNEISKDFLLGQNYPNPFNPVTKIRFSVPVNKVGERGLSVRLLIYDALGREIITLINEQLNPGIYEISWDAANRPSGIYFYKLITEEYTETKKMILIK